MNFWDRVKDWYVQYRPVIAGTVFAATIGVTAWLANKQQKDMERDYEYYPYQEENRLEAEPIDQPIEGEEIVPTNDPVETKEKLQDNKESVFEDLTQKPHKATYQLSSLDFQ